MLANLAEIGYDTEWQTISAADMGAPHKRERVWIIAYPHSYSESGQSEYEGKRQRELVSTTEDVAYTVNDTNRTGARSKREKASIPEKHREKGLPGESVRTSKDKKVLAYPDDSGERTSKCSVDGIRTAEDGQVESQFESSRQSEMADSEGSESGESSKWEGREDISRGSQEISNSASNGCKPRSTERKTIPEETRWAESNIGDKTSREVSDSTESRLPGKKSKGEPGGESGLSAERDWWKFEPSVCMLADGPSNKLERYKGRLTTESYKRADQLKCLGNSIVPQIACLLFEQIKSSLSLK